MPEYISSNKRPKEKEKEEKVSCTCTKSGCNKNYCECYKNKTKCNDLCRCRNCENHEKNEAQKSKDKIACYKANSIYIMNNKIIVEDLLNNQNRKKIKIMFSDIFSSLSSPSFLSLSVLALAANLAAATCSEYSSIAASYAAFSASSIASAFLD